jgi:membrane-bound metal-dependent hydrolase YbcI (DUF457 family)
MFLGHFGVALAAKKVAPEVSAGTAILAACFLDVAWPVLVLTGVERVEIAPGITRVTPLDFTHYPWSHSLAMAIAWGAGFAAVYYALRRNLRNALWLAALVVSHWLLDWIVHRPDLPLYPGEAARHGLGLWNSLPVTLAIEAAIFAAGIYIYRVASRPRDRIGSVGFWALVAFLAACYAGAVFGPPPPSVGVLAGTSLFGLVLVAWAAWVDRHRMPAGSLS